MLFEYLKEVALNNIAYSSFLKLISVRLFKARPLSGLQTNLLLKYILSLATKQASASPSTL